MDFFEVNDHRPVLSERDGTALGAALTIQSKTSLLELERQADHRPDGAGVSFVCREDL